MVVVAVCIMYGVQDTASAVHLACGVGTAKACGHKKAAVPYGM
jgi:hypothetical protein